MNDRPRDARGRSAEHVQVVLVNNYDMIAARAGFAAGTYPGHHLYGTANLPPGFVVHDLPYRPGGLLSSLSARLPLGELDQQWAILRLRRRGRTVILGANAVSVRVLALLRAGRLLRNPIVAVVHGAPRSHRRLQDMVLRGTDVVITLSESVARELNEQHRVPWDRIVALPWGPDLDFFGAPQSTTPDAPVVSLGKSARDPETLAQALGRTGHRARVYVLTPLADRPPNVEEVPASLAAPTPGRATYDHVLADLRAAALVAIPLKGAAPYHGLTELGEAMACGKPVIMTRVPFIDVDIERIGCGLWVDEGDVAGWEAALNEILTDRARAAEMGDRGRRYVGERLNERTFSGGVVRILGALCAERPSDRRERQRLTRRWRRPSRGR